MDSIVSTVGRNHNLPDPWFTVSQAAAILGIPKSQVKKKYPFTVVDGVRLFHQDDIGYNPKVGAM
jgi:hypothetical protein